MANRLDKWSAAGGSLKLLDLIREHPAEFAFDFRSKFQLSYLAIGDSVSYLEAIYLTSILMKDTSSWVGSKLAKWTYPVTREWIITQDLYNLTYAIASKKLPKPYPTPWKQKGEKSLGKIGGRTQQEILDRLEKMNPKESDAS